MARTLIAYTNPWSFAIAVERAIAAEQPRGSVDVVNLNLLTEHSALARPVDRFAEALNRKYERFILPAISGRDITADVGRSLRGYREPALPNGAAALRAYTAGDARIGLAVLSSITSLTTIESPTDLSEYGPALPRVWRTAHLSAEVGRAVETMGYDAAYIFNGRHCISRPFCDVLQQTATVYRYEQGGAGNRYIVSEQPIHDPTTVAKLIGEHDFDAAEGEEFFAERLRKGPGSVARFFTATQVDELLPEGVEPGRTVALFTSSADELYAVSDTLGYGSFKSQYEAARTIAQACANRGETFVVRFHPHLQFKHDSWKREWDFERLRELGAIIAMPGDPIDTYALVRASRCIFTFGSTVGFEASFLGVPAAEIGTWAGGMAGAMAIANSPEEIRRFIDRPVMSKGARGQAIRFGSYARRAGKLLPELEVGSHPYYARIAGRIVDPVRYVYQRLRSPFSPISRIALPPGGKVIVEPQVLKNVAQRLRALQDYREAG